MAAFFAHSIFAAIVATAWAGFALHQKKRDAAAGRTDTRSSGQLAAVASALVLVPSALALLALTWPGLEQPLVVRLLSLDLNGSPHAIGLSLYLDRLSLAMLPVIGIIGFVVYRFAQRYLLGEPTRDRFLAHLSWTIASVELLVVSGNLAMLALCWMSVSAGLHGLLQHYSERERAITAARKKFVISRIGDLSLLFAAGVLFDAFGTLDLATLFEGVERASSAETDRALSIAGFGFALAAICKSAQVPFHTWLPDTLETPTPVSALMHAGIVNAGGYLLIRTSPLLSPAHGALDILVVVGAVTAGLGMLVMWAQPDVKRGLAWSTVGQMGFMILECGLGAFAAAFVHLAGHGFYKAHAFLRSGTLDLVVQPRPRPLSVGRASSTLLAGWLLAGLVTYGALTVLGHHPASMPGGLTLFALLTLAIAQFLTPTESNHFGWFTRASAIVAYTLVMVGGIVLIDTWLSPGLGEVAALETRGVFGVGLALFVVMSMAAISLWGAALPRLSATRFGRALYVHSLHGFYLGMWLDGALRRVWPLPHASRERSLL